MIGTRRVRHGTPRGFTLIEILVVVAIIAVLTAMAVPSIRHARALARRSACMTNLKSLHRANAMARTKDHQEKGRALDWLLEDKSTGWPYRLLPFLSDNIDFFFCPDDLGIGESEYIRGVVPLIRKGQPGEGIPMPLEEGEFTEIVSRLSSSAYRMIFEDLRAPGESRDSTPGQYDGNGHAGWVLQLLVEEEYGIPVKITVDWIDTGYTHDLVDGRGNLLLADLSGGDTYQMKTPAVSYGINRRAGFLKPDGGWILMMDYERSIARCTGAEIATGAEDNDPLTDYDDDWEQWWDEDLERYTFARHIGQANALHVNGSVSSYFPKDINPHPNRGEDQGLDDVKKAAKSRRDRYWDPPPPRVRFDNTSENDHTDREDDPDAPGSRW